MIVYVYVVSGSNHGNLAVVGSFRKAWKEATNYLSGNRLETDNELQFSEDEMKAARTSIKKAAFANIVHVGSKTTSKIEKFILG